MATKIEAMRKYGPRIAPGQPVSMREAVRFMCSATGQTEAEVVAGILNLRRMFLHFGWSGRNVHLDDLLGTRPIMVLEGDMHFDFQGERQLNDELKTGFTGVIENAENIGKTMDELVAIWNADPANANDLIPTG